MKFTMVIFQLVRNFSVFIRKYSGSVGIEDPNYFARVFKRVEGISPKQNRENW